MTTRTSKLVFLATLVALLACAASAARPSSTMTTIAHRPRGEELAIRLKLGGGCWESLVELQACTGEVLVFLLDGETHLGPGCCRAIRVISQHCWPALFASLGFTPEEVVVLQGFCEAPPPLSPPPTPSLPPSPSPAA